MSDASVYSISETSIIFQLPFRRTSSFPGLFRELESMGNCIEFGVTNCTLEDVSILRHSKSDSSYRISQIKSHDRYSSRLPSSEMIRARTFLRVLPTSTSILRPTNATNSIEFLEVRLWVDSDECISQVLLQVIRRTRYLEMC